MAGYTRQDTANNIANGNVIDADVFDDEYNAIESAFNASTGHTHDGTTGGGAPIEKMGPSQDLTVSAAALTPKTTNTLDIGTSALQFKDAYLDGTLYSDGITNEGAISQTGDSTFTGTVDVTGNTGIDGDFDINTNKFTVANATGNTAIAGTLAVTGESTLTGNVTAEGTLQVDGAAGVDGDFDVNTNKFTVQSTTGNTTIAGTLAVTGETTLTGNATAEGTFQVDGAAGVDGDFDVNTDKFTVQATTGNTAIAGTLDVTGDMTAVNLDATTLDVSGAVGLDGNLDVGTDKFTVDATNGNTAVAGTLDVTGNQTNTGDLTVNGNTTLGDAATDTVTFNADIASNVIPDADGTRDLGDTSNYWANVYADAITTTANVNIGGDITITGNLTVDGTTTTLNTATLEVEDKNIVLGDGLTTAASANGGGITLEGADATILYDSTSDRWDFNKNIEVTSVYANLTGNVTGNVDGIVGGTTPAAVTGTTVQFNTGLTDGTITIDGFVDEDDMTSNSATKVPTQQSVKAYVDDAIAGDGTATIDASSVDATDLSVTTSGGLDLNGGAGTGWVIYQSGTSLKFKYNGTDRFSLSSAGALVVENDITAYGAA